MLPSDFKKTIQPKKTGEWCAALINLKREAVSGRRHLSCRAFALLKSSPVPK
jgi:hypothetical protein